MISSLTQLFQNSIIPANLPTCQPANLPTCQPANLPTCQPANLPTCQPARNVSRSRYALILALLTGSAPALAAVVLPYDQHVVVNQAWDKDAGAPLDISGGMQVFWNADGGHDDSWDNASQLSWIGWVCQSASDPTFGACPVRLFNIANVVPGSAPIKATDIRLRFTEQRSRVSATLTLKGAGRYVFYNTSSECYGGVGPSYLHPMHYTMVLPCADKSTATGRLLQLWITPESLKSLPVGGIWKATLRLNEHSWRNQVLARFTADITLDMTDRNNGQIYLPAFGSATPLVDLNLRTRPLSTAPGGQVSGSTTIDTCLYDGYNSNSSWLSVTLSDTANALGRGADIFSVVKEGAGQADARNRVDYRVTLHYNGQARKMENGKALRLSGANTATIRPVALPGYPVPVVCIPAPLALDVEPFAKASKTAGRYSGTLKINLAAEALAP